MGKARYVNTDFWTDPWVVDTLTPDEVHLFMYLMTNPQTNLAGVYELSMRIMSFQVGYDKDKILLMLKHMEPKVMYVDGWIVLRNCIKNQNYKNAKIARGICAVLDSVPSQLLQHVAWPSDFGQEKPKGSQQTTMFDESSMTDEESSHLIKLNYNNNNLLRKLEKPSKIDDPDVDELFAYWNEKTGIPISRNMPSNKTAARTLLKRHAMDGMRTLINAVSAASTDRYAPMITDFVSLRDKEAKLLVWARKQRPNGKVAVIK